jgi:hypothetical protein
MTNIQLKFLVSLYKQTSKKLDTLKEVYEKLVIHEKVLTALEESLKNDAVSKYADNQEQLKFLAFVNDTLVVPEAAELEDKAHHAKIKVNEHHAKVQIAYLEAKLNAIKSMVGVDIVKRIEESEIDNAINS